MQAVVFDMDGVLVDSELHWKDVESAFLRRLVPAWDDELQHSILGMSLYDVYALLVREHGVTETLEEFLDNYRDLAHLIYAEKSNLLPGVVELIDRLREAGLKLAVASSSPREWIEMTVERFGFQSRFLKFVSSDDVGGKGKPAPDIYLHAAVQLGVEPSACAAIEDTGKGIASAKAAGMKCIGYRNGFNDKQNLSEADLVTDDFSALSVEKIRSLFA